MPLNSSDLNSSVCTNEMIRDEFQSTFPSGLAKGEIGSVTLDSNNYNLAYVVNLVPGTKDETITRKVDIKSYCFLETIIER